MAYSALTNAETTARKAVTQPLMRKVKDNFDFLFSSSSGGPTILNSGFEVDADGDGTPDNWTTTAYAGGTVGLESTSPIAGIYSLKMVHPGGAANGGGNALSDYIECAPGRPGELSWIHYCSAAGMKDQVVMKYYDAAKVTIGADETIYSSTANPTAATFQNAIYTPPATARFMKIQLIGGYTDTNVAGTSYWDLLSLENEGPRSNIITITRNHTTGSGAVSYTGVGFKPRAVVFVGAVTNAVGTATIGFTAGASDNRCIASNYPEFVGAWSVLTNCIHSITAINHFSSAVLTSFDIDGFTLTWTKFNTPSGTLTVYALCLR